MPNRIPRSMPASALCAVLMTATFAGPAAAQSAANVAQDFLNKVESGNTGAAFQMLSTSARQGHSASDLKAPPRDAASMRKVAFQGPVDAEAVGQHEPGRYFIVCMIDVPNGSGAVTNVAVTVMLDAQSEARIADYRYDSHPTPACASRM